jgi:hypothetical protein
MNDFHDDASGGVMKVHYLCYIIMNDICAGADGNTDTSLIMPSDS